MEEEKIGQITHYFDNIGVAAISLESPLKVGNQIHVKGATTDFTQLVESMQINREEIHQANAGEEVGLKTKEMAREGDVVFLVSEE